MYRDYWSTDDFQADEQTVKVRMLADIDHPSIHPLPATGQTRLLPLHLARHLISRRLATPLPSPPPAYSLQVREALKADAASVHFGQVAVDGVAVFYEGAVVASAVQPLWRLAETAYTAYKGRLRVMVAPLYGGQATSCMGSDHLDKHEQRVYKMAQRANQSVSAWLHGPL